MTLMGEILEIRFKLISTKKGTEEYEKLNRRISDIYNQVLNNTQDLEQLYIGGI